MYAPMPVSTINVNMKQCAAAARVSFTLGRGNFPLRLTTNFFTFTSLTTVNTNVSEEE